MTTEEFDPSYVDTDVYNRIVETAIELITEQHGGTSSLPERREIILSILEDISGFEDPDVAIPFSKTILRDVNKRLGS